MVIPIAFMALILGVGLTALFSADEAPKVEKPLAPAPVIIQQTEKTIFEKTLQPDCIYRVVVVSPGPDYKIYVKIARRAGPSMMADLKIKQLPLPPGWVSDEASASYIRNHLKVKNAAGTLDMDVSPDLKTVSRLEFLPANAQEPDICENQAIETF